MEMFYIYNIVCKLDKVYCKFNRKCFMIYMNVIRGFFNNVILVGIRIGFVYLFK